MKIITSMLTLLALSFAPSGFTKFAQFVAQIPCELVEFAEVYKCEASRYSNLEAMFYRNGQLSQLRKRRLGAGIQFEGALIEAQVKKTTPSKCSAGQQIKLKDYRPRYQSGGRGRFFVVGATCENAKKVLILRELCDTPGALEIRDCFISRLNDQFKFSLGLKK